MEADSSDFFEIISGLTGRIRRDPGVGVGVGAEGEEFNTKAPRHKVGKQKE